MQSAVALEELDNLCGRKYNCSIAALSIAPSPVLQASPHQESLSDCCCYSPSSPTLSLRLVHKH